MRRNQRPKRRAFWFVVVGTRIVLLFQRTLESARIDRELFSKVKILFCLTITANAEVYATSSTRVRDPITVVVPISVPLLIILILED